MLLLLLLLYNYLLHTYTKYSGGLLTICLNIYGSMVDVKRAGQRIDYVKSSSTYWRLVKTAMDFSKCCEIIGLLKGKDS